MPTLKGHLIFGGQGFKSRDVKLYEISETQFDKSKLIASTSSDSGGMFEFYGVNISPKNTYYISASDGFNKLLGLLQSSDTQGLTINDLSTAASAYTFNRFINGEELRGNIMRPTGLEVDSAGNVWVANNYNKKADLYGLHSVFQAIGLADPVETPLIGPVAPLLWTTAPQSLI